MNWTTTCEKPSAHHSCCLRTNFMLSACVLTDWLVLQKTPVPHQRINNTKKLNQQENKTSFSSGPYNSVYSLISSLMRPTTLKQWKEPSRKKANDSSHTVGAALQWQHRPSPPLSLESGAVGFPGLLWSLIKQDRPKGKFFNFDPSVKKCPKSLSY